MAAAQGGHLAALDRLLSADGCDAAAADAADANGTTAVMLAAKMGHAAAVERHLAAGASPNEAHDDGFTPLMTAAEAGHAQVDNSGKKAPSTDYVAEFGDARWAELAANADNLRKLVRIKVADDNDLKTARQALLICREFFDGIGRLGRLQGIADDFAVIEELASLTC